jgi:hypothetical protein
MGTECAGNVHEFADSQLGHVFATGATRDAARRTLVAALRTLMVRGQVRCTTETLISLLESPGTSTHTASPVSTHLCAPGDLAACRPESQTSGRMGRVIDFQQHGQLNAACGGNFVVAYRVLHQHARHSMARHVDRDGLPHSACWWAATLSAHRRGHRHCRRCAVLLPHSRCATTGVGRRQADATPPSAHRCVAGRAGTGASPAQG